MKAKAIVMTLVLAGLGAQRPVHSQTHQDTVSVYSAALASRLGEGPVGPFGAIEVLCEVAASDGFRLVFQDDADAVPTDTFPEVTPRILQLVSQILLAEHGLPLVDDCDRMIDGLGRPGIRISVSAPVFEGEDVATFYLSSYKGPRWGTGARCTWRRKDGAWVRTGCTGGWVSDRPPESVSAPPFVRPLVRLDWSSGQRGAHSV